MLGCHHRCPCLIGLACCSILLLYITVCIADAVIWVMALLFGLPPLALKQFQSLNAPIPRLFRSFSGGIIMALALVHIIPEALES